jgi:hypothetical protein
MYGALAPCPYTFHGVILTHTDHRTFIKNTFLNIFYQLLRHNSFFLLFTAMDTYVFHFSFSSVLRSFAV